MHNLNNYKIAKQLPIKVLVKRILKKVFPKKNIDYSFQELRNADSDFTIQSLVDVKSFETKTNQKQISSYLEHKIDLLGSGLVDRNSQKRLELHTKHKSFSKSLTHLVTENYNFIDWQLDIKSGFSFNIKNQFNDQKINKSMSVDIKNCWELGRLQHLPQLAIAASIEKNREELMVEFKNQIIDFIGSNPIGMGVQWACSMDVGIRVSNLLVAFDVFKQADYTHILDGEFTSLFIDNVYQHGHFLWNNLEQKEGAAGNHYLFNLVGLLFVTNYLSENEETVAWKKFAEKEVVVEFQKQFFTDGGNFEGSTTYHCLSSEAVLYSTALMLRNGKKLNTEYIELLGNAFHFIRDVKKPNGEFPQFGDNDSGRLFKFCQDENLLNYEALISGFSALFNEEDDSPFEHLLVKQLSRSSQLRLVDKKSKKKFQLKRTTYQVQKPITSVFNFTENLKLEELKFFAYEEFGIYGFKSDAFYLSISVISNKKMHHSWGHVHNDKLSFELQVNGKDLVKDPGTFSYSAFPIKRMKFRSSEAHHGIVVKGIDQNKNIGLFYLEREVECEVLEIDAYSITLSAKYYGVEHTRKFSIFSDQLIVTDSCNQPFRVNINNFEAYAPNYGTIQNKV
jgi:hypothetical protein